jgi:hypothetical protein
VRVSVFAVLVCIVALTSWYVARPEAKPTLGIKVSGVRLCPAPDVAAAQDHTLTDWSGEVGAPALVRDTALIDSDGTSVGSVEFVIADLSATELSLSVERDFSTIEASADADVVSVPNGSIAATAQMRFSATSSGRFPVFLLIHFSQNKPCESSVGVSGLIAVRIGTFVAASSGS